jgi:hypothetical protein
MNPRTKPDEPTEVRSIRFPADLYRWLKAEAVKDNRTFTQQVVYLLRKAMEAEQAAREAAKEGKG